eukprot:3743589-Alexandrium_andersonii.AAC.1
MGSDDRRRGLTPICRVLHLVVGVGPRHSGFILFRPRSGGARKRGPATRGTAIRAQRIPAEPIELRRT